MSSENQSALECTIEACLDCSEACLLTTAWCLEQMQDSIERGVVKTLQLCAETCQLTAKALLLQSPVAQEYTRLCASVTQDCGESLAEMEEEELKTCGEACRLTSLVCRSLLMAPLPEGVTRISSHFRI